MNDRSRIAAMALQGLLANPAHAEAPNGAFAREAVLHADALLAELSKVSPPASNEPKEGPPSECSAGEAGDTKEGLRPRDLGGADGPTQRVVCGSAATESAPPPSIYVFDCEVDRYVGDGPCARPVSYDPFSGGQFCELHMTAVPSGRAEWHRRNGHRNQPAAKARRIAEALP